LNTGLYNASTVDAAMAIQSSIGSNGWYHGIAFVQNTPTGTIQKPMNTAGDLMYSDAAFTIANGLNLGNVTITGNAIAFPNTTLTGAGALTTVSEVLTGATPTVGAGQVGFGNSTGVASACNVLVSITGTATINVAGTNHSVPYC
jgi:hypothetical protein